MEGEKKGKEGGEGGRSKEQRREAGEGGRGRDPNYKRFPLLSVQVSSEEDSNSREIKGSF